MYVGNEVKVYEYVYESVQSINSSSSSLFPTCTYKYIVTTISQHQHNTGENRQFIVFGVAEEYEIL